LQQFQQSPAIQTTADIKRLKEIGALEIQSDETQHGLKLKFQVNSLFSLVLSL
jgi:ribosomal protein S3AE